MSEIKNADEFMLGQLDCKNGEAVKNGRPEDYYRGFSAQYQHEQKLTNQTEKQNGVNS